MRPFKKVTDNNDGVVDGYCEYNGKLNQTMVMWVQGQMTGTSEALRETDIL